MDCRKWRALVSRELDGELDGADRGGLERHVERCARCAAFRELIREAASIHRSGPERDPSPRLVASILAEAGAARRSPRIGGWLRFAVPAAAAAVFVLGFWVGSLMHERFGGEGVSTVASGAMGLDLEYLGDSPPGSFGNIVTVSYEGGEE